jgi:hypothetical protein
MQQKWLQRTWSMADLKESIKDSRSETASVDPAERRAISAAMELSS